MTRHFTALAAAALALVALAACSTTKKEDRPAELTRINPQFKPKKVWSVGLGHGQPKLLLGIGPAVDGKHVYGTNSVGEVVALDLATGHRVWKRQLKQPLSGGTGAGGGLVLVTATNGTLYALSEQDGSDRWHVQLSSEVLTAPVVADNLVLVRTVDGKLYGLEAGTGAQRWIADQQVPRLTLRGTSQPVIAGELAISGFDNGRLMAVTLATGNTAWDVAVAQPRGSSELQRLIDVDSPAGVDDDDVFAVAFQGRAVRLARETGLEIWSHDISSYRGLAVDGLGVYVSTAGGDVIKLDRASGAERWRQQGLVRRSLTGLALQRNAIVVADYQGVIHWLDHEDGKFLARAKGRARISATPIVAGDLVIVQTDTGRIEVWRAQWH
jgi:outer membrane protein assembly factor BamB